MPSSKVPSFPTPNLIPSFNVINTLLMLKVVTRDLNQQSENVYNLNSLVPVLIPVKFLIREK